MSRPSSILSSALLVLLIVSMGCGQSSFVGRRFDNFTAFYNTFYNAEKAYREGIKAMEASEEPVDRQTYLSVFQAPRTATGQHFLNAVNKSADVLRDHSDSKWVDDALLLIGKSYFFQQNYVGAEQKFGEVINLGTPLQDEARLWLARTLIAAGAYDEARDHLTTSLNREDLSKRWAPQLHLALGELHVKQGAFEDAALELEAGIEDVHDKNLEGRAWFLLGQVLETLGRYEQAATSYENVERTHPRYELSYAAQYSSVRVQGIHIDPDEALRRLRRMERDDKNYSNRFELAYLRGRIYQSDGYEDDAWNRYYEILYDSDEQIGEIRGRVHYALGELYRDQYKDYLRAAAHFDTARTAIAAPRNTATTSRLQPQYAPEAIQDAERQSEMFRSFAGVRREIARMDSLLALGDLSDEEFAARIIELRKDLAREQAEMQRRADQLQAQRGFQAAGAQIEDRQAQAQQAAGSTEAGFLFHRDPVRVQEARMSFLMTWGERPHVPNWRRMDAVSGSTGESFASGEAAPRPIREGDPAVGESPLPPLDYSGVPRDSLSRAAMLAERALARYELANVLFLAMNRPDSAATWYRLVIEEDEGEEVAQRAFYALAEVHRSLGDSAAANRLYEQVLQDYPESDFAGRVREQLGIRQDVPSDTLALAIEAYERAAQRWRRGRFSEALNDMVVIAADYRQTDAAPKSLLAAGQIFLEWAARDSLKIFGPIPLTVSDSILVLAGLIEDAPDTLAVHLPEPGAEITPDDSTTAEPSGPRADAAIISETPAGDPAVISDPSVNDPAPVSQDTPIEEQLPEASPTAQGDTLNLPDDSLFVPSKPSPPEMEAAAAGQAVKRTITEFIGAKADTLEVPSSDSLEVPAVEDTPVRRRVDAPVLPDSGGVSVDEDLAAAAAADASLGIPPVPDTSVAGVLLPDSALADGTEPLLVAEEPVVEEGLTLTDLYTGVKELYPNTPYAKLAGTLLLALQDRRKELEAAADSLARVDMGSLAGIDTDSLAGVGADSLAGIETDSLAGIETDSLAGIDTDSLAGVGADSLERGADSTPDTLLAEAVEYAAPDSQDVLLEAILTNAAEVDNPVGRRPDATVDSMAPLSMAAEPTAADSTAVEPTTAEPTAATDYARLDGFAERAHLSADTLASGGPPTELAIPAGNDAVHGKGGIRRELGGYTLILGMNVKREPMEALAEKYAKLGFRTDVLVERAGQTEIYRAALGHFASQREAGMFLNEHSTHIEEGVQLSRVTPPEQ